MHFKINNELLLPALNLLNGIVDVRQTITILSHLHLHLKDNILQLTGSDLEIELKIKIIVEQKQEGEVTLSCQNIFDFCRLLKTNAKITFETTEQKKILVSSGKSQFVFASLDASTYPHIAKIEPINSFNIKQTIFHKLLKEVSFCMANQDSRNYLNGALLEINNNLINFVATDSYRLAISSTEIESVTDQLIRIIVPRKSVIQLIKIMENEDNYLNVQLAENQLYLTIDNVAIIIRLIDEKYPIYERVIPKLLDKEIVIDKELLRNSLLRTSILSSENVHGLKLEFFDNKLHFKATNVIKEVVDDELIIDYQHEKVEFGFNVYYLLEALNNIESDQVKISIKNGSYNCLIQNTNKKYPMYIVSPMLV